MFGQIATVLRTELKMHFRDRRSLSSAMSLPILGPVMFAAMMIAMAGWLNADDPLKVPVVGAQHAPGLIEHLERAGVIIEAPPEDPEAVIASDDAHVVLVIPEDYPESFTKGEPAHLQLIHDSSKNASRVPVRRLERHLEAYPVRSPRSASSSEGSRPRSSARSWWTTTTLRRRRSSPDSSCR